MGAVAQADLTVAYDGSWFTILGCGGDLNEWVTGVETMLAEDEIGKPTGWFQTTGEAVNRYASKNGEYPIPPFDRFQSDLAILMFPLDGLEVGKLALFKLILRARWFDDVIDNMRRSDGEEE